MDKRIRFRRAAAAYDLRLTGLKWKEVAEVLNIKDPERARQWAALGEMLIKKGATALPWLSRIYLCSCR